MPPSGFVRSETDHITKFVISLIARFEEEIHEGIHGSQEIGIASELKTIGDHLQLPGTSDIERGILLLCRELYRALQKGKEIDEITKELKRLPDKKYD